MVGDNTLILNGVRECGKKHPRRGNVVLLAAVMMVFLFGMVALGLDLGYIFKIQGDLDRAVDSAVLAGAGLLVEGQAQAQDQIFSYLALNPVGKPIIVDDAKLTELKAWYETRQNQFLVDESGNVVVDENGDPVKLLDLTIGRWDPNGGPDGKGAVDPYEEDGSPVERPSVIGLSVVQDQHPFFFAKVFGKKYFDVKSEAVAMYQPRDIAVVLDYSGSMNDDSELQSIDDLGSNTVLANLRQIYEDLGSPTYGNMQWEPVYISSTNDSYVKSQLGLDGVSYPYPGGSWNEYINYVQSSFYQPGKNGYRKKYGYLTLVNYWLERRPDYSDTPDLWKTREQPIHALKQATGFFVDYIADSDTEDRVGLAVYNAPNGEGKLEVSLTDQYDIVKTTSNQRQASHYHNYTNIGAGMRTARLELRTVENGGHARESAFRLMVLMTDGQANWYNGNYNESAANQDVINEANLAKQMKIPIVTISLGAGADTQLMQQVADITGGVHFNIPGGQTGAQYEEALVEVFRTIADARPLRLLQ